MNKILLILISSLVVVSCVGKHKSESQSVNISEQVRSPLEISGDTANVNPSHSKILWKGTKMHGTGKHEGDIALKTGYFITQNGQLKGGEFIVDMQTIEVTDIPKHDPVPRNNLKNHLKNSDFFDVDKFPTSIFQITEIKNFSKDSINVSGNLTIKGITNGIEFSALINENKFTSRFTFNRFDWNIAYEGSWADKTLVDKDIELTIEIVME
ncbi:YceI family protein [Antarcticibacterium arcticum]|uniref:YceI family protein n=1 Tax=Antarcticibacterium arcticum TaxID=2585771 RepID=A0A5B8YK23_9FLAO|nr:YceI family protein [Antarcticibacterium arcticum]QED38084.1 YceI family protein [Antarcticibacterium arcticum]